MIISADTSDGNLLTKIALTSKAYWGYNINLIESWKNDLTVTSKMIEETTTNKFLNVNKTVGFYVLNPPNGRSIQLEMLFVRSVLEFHATNLLQIQGVGLVTFLGHYIWSQEHRTNHRGEKTSKDSSIDLGCGCSVLDNKSQIKYVAHERTAKETKVSSHE